MNIITLTYFASGNDGICASDFRNAEKSIDINPEYILSLSKLTMFQQVFSGSNVGLVSLLTMSNNDKYYLNETQYNNLVAML